MYFALCEVMKYAVLHVIVWSIWMFGVMWGMEIVDEETGCGKG